GARCATARSGEEEGARVGSARLRRNRRCRLLCLDAPASIQPASLAVGAPPRPEPPHPAPKQAEAGAALEKKAADPNLPRSSPGNAAAPALGKKGARATPSRPPPSERGGPNGRGARRRGGPTAMVL
ncbi:unnamed protein product, partial [Urochloa humidicola]